MRSKLLTLSELSIIHRPIFKDWKPFAFLNHSCDFISKGVTSTYYEVLMLFAGCAIEIYSSPVLPEIQQYQT